MEMTVSFTEVDRFVYMSKMALNVHELFYKTLGYEYER
jgi:hypothetical protein